MILTEAEIKNLMTTYHGNEAFVIGVAVGKSIEAHKACEWLKNNYGHFDGSLEDLLKDFRKATED